MKNQKIILAISSVAIIVAFLVGAYFYKNTQTEKLGFMATENAELFVRDYAPTMGPENAKVILVEFLDPECESCRAFYPFVKKLLADNPDKIRLVIRYRPFHGNSKFVVRILEAARKQGKDRETLELLFQTQPRWGSHHDPKPELIWDYLPILKLDVAKIRKDMKDPAINKVIAQDIADGEKLGVRATPSFFINGKPLAKFGYKQLQDAIEAEIIK